MSEERSQFARQIDERTFSPSRRGYDKTEVRSFLQDLEQAFRELEGHSRRQAQRLVELERAVSQSRATEKVSVDNAMLAVFDAKNRILERARRKAEEIEDNARLEAGRIREAALKESGAGEGAAAGEIAAARAQADEIVASARREADRLRTEATPQANEDLEAELADMGVRIQRAHDETAAARAELDAARKRIVELEHRPPAESAELKAKFAELERLVSESREDANRLAGELESERAELDRTRQAAMKAEQALSDMRNRMQTMEADLEAARAKADQVEQERLAAVAGREETAADLAAARAEIERLQAVGASASADAELLEQTEVARQELAAKLAESEAGRTEAVARLGELEQNHQGLLGRYSTVEKERDGLTARLTAAEQADVEVAAEQSSPEHEPFAGRMAAFQTQVAGGFRREDTLALLAETRRIGESVLVDAGGEVADDAAEATAAAQQILEEARVEAAAITAEAEEEADQRAAKVIAKAREEADQVRQTVATLTAQAEDARSAALRSKIEADDLAEAQRAMSEARDNIIHTAENRAAEIRADAESDAAAIRAEAEETLRLARQEAASLPTETTEAVPIPSVPTDGPAIIEASTASEFDSGSGVSTPTADRGGEPEEPEAVLPDEIPDEAVDLDGDGKPNEFDVASFEASSGESPKSDRPVDAPESDGEPGESAVTSRDEIREESAETDPASDVQDSDGEGDELAALLAATEEDLAAGEELRKQREELDEREAELAAQQAETAMLFASSRDTMSGSSDPNATTEPIEEDSPLTATSGPSEPYSFDIAVEEPAPLPAIAVDEEEEEDPAERLSALLEEVAPTAADPDPDPLDLDKPSPDLVATEHELDSETPIDEALPDLSGLLEVLDDADSSDVPRDADVAEVPEYAEAENAGTKVVSAEGPARGPEPAFEPAGSGRPRVAWPAPVRVDDSNSDGDKKGDSEDRQSRYSSHSAQLPQLGEKAQSNASTIANLRKKGRGRR